MMRLPYLITRFARFLTEEIGGIYLVDGVNFGSASAETRCSIDSIHPTSRVSASVKLDLPIVGEINIYTDGSRIDGNVGAAYSVFLFGKIIDQASFKLPSHATVYQAEMLAIERALLWCSSGSTSFRRKITVYSDSLSVLRALSNPESCQTRTLNAKDSYRKALEGDDVSLNWVKADVGFEGNEPTQHRKILQTSEGRHAHDPI